jgi:hypothetical protein
MDVRSVETAGTEETHGNRSTIADEGWESVVIGSDSLATSALNNTGDSAVILEVEE